MIVVGGQDGSDQDAADGQGVNIRLIQSRGFGFGAVFLSPVCLPFMGFYAKIWYSMDNDKLRFLCFILRHML